MSIEEKIVVELKRLKEAYLQEEDVDIAMKRLEELFRMISNL